MLKYTFSAEGFDGTEKLQKYVETKVKDLEKYIPRVSRGSADLAVRLRRTKSKAEMYECRLELTLKQANLIATEQVEHAYSAVDVTMAEVRRQLADYKSKHSKQSLRHRAATFLRRGNSGKTTDNE